MYNIEKKKRNYGLDKYAWSNFSGYDADVYYIIKKGKKEYGIIRNVYNPHFYMIECEFRGLVTSPLMIAKFLKKMQSEGRMQKICIYVFHKDIIGRGIFRLAGFSREVRFRKHVKMDKRILDLDIYSISFDCCDFS